MNRFKLLLILLSLPFLSISQEKWEGGLFLGYSNYMGDLVKPDFTLKEASPAFGILLRNHLNKNFGLRANLIYGKISGDDNNYVEYVGRGTSFESTLVELSLLGEYEFFGHKRYDDSGKFFKVFSPYVFLGLGASFGNPKVTYGTTPNDDSEADFSNTHLCVPLGVGLKFDVSRKINIGLELGTRLSFSDYLDGVSLTGNSDLNDIYYMGGVVVGFRFGDQDSDGDGVVDENDKCPTQVGTAALNGCPDTDGDGLADRDDSCPTEAGDVRLNGCPDRDTDGVADNQDDCPDQAGLRRFAGCPDSDNDNIIDKEDNCPNEAGIPAMNGCPDSDRDGIMDSKDKCPTVPGTAEHGGCPDTDNDGLSDADDECPTLAGTRKFNGCPDSDNDGIIDPKDKCPLLVGPANNDGCPEISPEDKETLNLAMRDVQFATGSAQLLPSSLTILNQVSELMKKYPGYKLDINGYTDNVGNDFANQQLSEQRAKACMDYIASKGISKTLLSATGHGESSPRADNSTSTGRRQNRRVEFTLKPQ